MSLEQDDILPPGQRFALLSFVSPISRQKNEQYGLKIRGVFNSREEADAYVKRLQKHDPHVDIFLCDMGKWLLIPPDVSKIEDVKYQEQYLETMMAEYQKSQDEARAHFEERKTRVMKQGIAAVDGGGAGPSSSSSANEALMEGADPHPSSAAPDPAPAPAPVKISSE